MTRLEQELSHININDCLNTVEYDSWYRDTAVKVILTYIPYRDGRISIDNFLKLIKDQIIVNFVINYKEIQKQYQRKDKLAGDKYLFDKAARKITRTTAKGKLGELLLYLLIEKYLQAPKIFSKISLLSDRNTHVKGADAVHAQYIDGDLVLYLGESKLWKYYSSACTDAVESIKTTLQEYEDEFDLIETHINFPNNNEDLERAILATLNPYDETGQSAIIHTPCFIGFDSRICRGVTSEDDYRNNYLHAAQGRINTFYRKAESHLNIDQITLFLLPFHSIDDFTNRFISLLGIES